MAASDQDTIRAHWKCFVACGVAVLSPFQYGIDFGMIGGLQAMPGFLQVYGYYSPEIGWNISTTRQQLISSLMTLGAFISSGTAGFTAAKLGRKTCLWLASVLCCASTVIMMATTSIEALYAGRFLIGLANGYFMTYSQLYIQETIPSKYRGLFLTAFQFCTSIGTLIGTIVDWATAPRPDRSSYLIPLGLIYAVPLFMSVALLFIPESPRWLILQGRREEGRKALLWLRPAGAPVDAEVAQIEAAIHKEREMGGSVSVLDMFKNPIDRRRTMISVGGVTTQAASGSMFIIAYKAYFFSMAKVADPFAMSCVLSTMGILAIFINSLVVVRYGQRRVMLMSGLVLCGILQLVVAVVYDKNPGAMETGKVLVALSCLYLMSYNAMIAPYAWVTGGEIPSQRLRSHTFGLAAAVGFLGAWVTTFTAPYFINPQSLNWGPRYGYIWLPSCIIATIWVYFCLPEVFGRTLEEIDEMVRAQENPRINGLYHGWLTRMLYVQFAARVPARKFKGYQCVGTGTTAEKEDIVVEEWKE